MRAPLACLIEFCSASWDPDVGLVGAADGLDVVGEGGGQAVPLQALGAQRVDQATHLAEGRRRLLRQYP